MEKEITITISGTASSGKTIIASTLLNILLDNCINVKYKHLSNDGDFPSQGNLDILKNKDVTVSIIETNVKIEPKITQTKIDFTNG